MHHLTSSRFWLLTSLLGITLALLLYGFTEGRLFGAGDHAPSAILPLAASKGAGYVYEGVAGYVPTAPASNGTPLYRLYNGASGDHFYTTSASERDIAVVRSGYAYEGIAAYVATAGGSNLRPLRRLWSPQIGDHFYTTNPEEAPAASSYVFEGNVGYVSPGAVSGWAPLYRLWNDASGDHFYTTDPGERDAAVGHVDTDGQIPYWIGFYSLALWDRYSLLYCLDGSGWSAEDHYLARDGLTTAWGWGKVNKAIAPLIQERCDDPAPVSARFVMDSAFVQTYCQPGTGFTVVACVSFDGWKWLESAGAWAYTTAIVHVEPYWWARSSAGWRELILIHEFGHAGIALNDTPNQACGVTVMDYVYELACGMSMYPSWLDRAVTNTLYGLGSAVGW